MSTFIIGIAIICIASAAWVVWCDKPETEYKVEIPLDGFAIITESPETKVQFGYVWDSVHDFLDRKLPNSIPGVEKRVYPDSREVLTSIACNGSVFTAEELATQGARTVQDLLLYHNILEKLHK